MLRAARKKLNTTIMLVMVQGVYKEYMDNAGVIKSEILKEINFR